MDNVWLLETIYYVAAGGIVTQLWNLIYIYYITIQLGNVVYSHKRYKAVVWSV